MFKFKMVLKKYIAFVYQQVKKIEVHEKWENSYKKVIILKMKWYAEKNYYSRVEHLKVTERDWSRKISKRW